MGPVTTKHDNAHIREQGGADNSFLEEVKIYYGAAEAAERLATTQLDERIDSCLSFR